MKDVIYQYVTGQEFAMQVRSIVSVFGQMRSSLDSEKRAMQKYWKGREKQIDGVLASVSGIYGAIEGFVGEKALPKIDPLMLEGGEDEAEGGVD